MDFFYSLEFYTLAIVAAIVIVGMLCRPSNLAPARSYICALQNFLAIDDDEEWVAASVKGSMVRVERHGVRMRMEESAHLVCNVNGDKIHIKERKSQERPGGDEQSTECFAELTFLKRGKYAVRYESEITGKWCNFTIIVADQYTTKKELKY